jgi:hypothetical protein
VRSEHLGRVRFTLPAAQPAAMEVKPDVDWSRLESRLRELVAPSSELSSEFSSKITVEPHVTLAYDPHAPLALLEQLNARNRAASTNSLNGINSEAAIDPPTSRDRGRAGDNRLQVDVLAYLASISSGLS